MAWTHAPWPGCAFRTLRSRPDWRPAKGKPGSSLADMKAQALDPFGVSYAICNPLFGVQMVFSEDMADAFCGALNDWLVKEWLDRDSRLRGSIVIPVQSVEKSVAEIERCAQDKRFAGHVPGTKERISCRARVTGLVTYRPFFAQCGAALRVPFRARASRS